jgi:hypothetical protein
MLSESTTRDRVGHLRHTGPRLHRLAREPHSHIEKFSSVIVDCGQIPTRRRRGVPGPPGNSMAAITRNSTKPAKQRSESIIGVVGSWLPRRCRETVTYDHNHGNFPPAIAPPKARNGTSSPLGLVLTSHFRDPLLRRPEGGLSCSAVAAVCWLLSQLCSRSA